MTIHVPDTMEKRGETGVMLTFRSPEEAEAFLLDAHDNGYGRERKATQVTLGLTRHTIGEAQKFREGRMIEGKRAITNKGESK
jgi:hypothetical protein